MTTDLVGRILGGCRLMAKIGSGALATVYKAYQPDLNRWVAVKVLHYRHQDALVRFQREAQFVARLRHRNILIVYSYGEEDDWPYIVMEYVEGGTLADRLTGRPLDWIKATDLMIPITDALSYAHDHGVVHRDVKPSNILMPQEDWPLLADFGLIKIEGTKQGNLTGPGTSIGTPAYIAPEQARGIEVDHRCDIYSVGVVLFEMITGRLPFYYPNPNKILLAHTTEPVPPPRKLNPDCPSAIERIILKAMRKLPEQRYQHMSEVTAALKEGLHSSDVRPAFHAIPPSQAVKTRELNPVALTSTGEPVSRSVPIPAEDTRLFLVDKKVSIPLPGLETIIIGRTHKDRIADIDLAPYGAAEAGVSRRHARLTKIGSGWQIDDLGSLNGTFVNSVKLAPGGPPVPLKDGDMIRCSHLSFLFLTTLQ